MQGVIDEPLDEIIEENEAELQRQDEAYTRQYENEHTWDQLQEDEHGLLRVDRTAEQRAKRRRLLSAAQSARIRKGMIRYVMLVIDQSKAASAPDLRPNRLSCMLSTCKAFIREFFDQNPLSQLGILVLRNGVAHRLTDLSGSPETQIRKLTEHFSGASGEASIQNALELGVHHLKHIPPYGHREMLFMFAALSTCDPGSVFDAIKLCKEQNVRVSFVGVAAEVYICSRVARDTGGTYGVAINEAHLEELMMQHAPPPPVTAAQARAELVRMGFPQRASEDAVAALYVGPDAVLLSGSYGCPRCKARVVELPCECHVCGLTLVSSPHLARSYHHLFPVMPYEEVDAAVLPGGTQATQALSTPTAGEAFMPPKANLCCYGCLQELQSSSQTADSAGKQQPQQHQPSQQMVLRCPRCHHYFCFECDVYVHSGGLHNCPGCACTGV